MTETARLTPAMGERDHTLGPEGATVTLMEYGDYECPYCGRAYPIVERIREHFGEDLRLGFRHFPMTDMHPHARIAAEAAEAAWAQGSFWEMHEKLFEDQENLEGDDLRGRATELNLDLHRFERELTEHIHLRRVEENMESGLASEVPGTPAFFINGVLHGDSYDFDTLRAAIEDAGAGRES